MLNQNSVAEFQLSPLTSNSALPVSITSTSGEGSAPAADPIAAVSPAVRQVSPILIFNSPPNTPVKSNNHNDVKSSIKQLSIHSSLSPTPSSLSSLSSSSFASHQTAKLSSDNKDDQSNISNFYVLLNNLTSISGESASILTATISRHNQKFNDAISKGFAFMNHEQSQILKQVNRIRELFCRQMVLPLAGLPDLFDEYR